MTSFKLEIPKVSLEQTISLEDLGKQGLVARIAGAGNVTLTIAGTPDAFSIYRKAENLNAEMENKIRFLRKMGHSMYPLCKEASDKSNENKAKDGYVINGIKGKLFKNDKNTGPMMMYWLYALPKVEEVVLLMFSEHEEDEVEDSMEAGLRMEMVNAVHKIAQGQGKYVEVGSVKELQKKMSEFFDKKRNVDNE